MDRGATHRLGRGRHGGVIRAEPDDKDGHLGYRLVRARKELYAHRRVRRVSCRTRRKKLSCSETHLSEDLEAHDGCKARTAESVSPLPSGVASGDRTVVAYGSLPSQSDRSAQPKNPSLRT